MAEEIDRVVEILVQNRRMRAMTDRWEERLFGLKWRCTMENCPEGPLPRNRAGIEDHLQKFHGFGPVAEQTAETRSEYEELIRMGQYEAR